MVHPQSGPFSELENVCQSEISIHFLNWKESTFPGPFLRTEKMTVHQSIIHQCSLPTWESSLPFSIRKSSPQAPAWVHKLFHLEQKLYQNVCLSTHLWRYILENHFSFLDFITENVMLDLNVLRSFWNNGFLKASYSYDHHSWIQLFCFLLAHNIGTRVKLGTCPSGTSSVIMRALSWIGNPSSLSSE